MIGGPAGIWSADMHKCGPGAVRAGEPLIRTRAAGASERAVTQGCGFVPAVKAQPANMPASAVVATGMPDTSTRTLLLMIVI